MASEHLAMVALEHDHLYTLVPNSGIGSYISQPCETRRLTPALLMEIMIQPQTLTKETSMANTHARQNIGLKPRSCDNAIQQFLVKCSMSQLCRDCSGEWITWHQEAQAKGHVETLSQEAITLYH